MAAVADVVLMTVKRGKRQAQQPQPTPSPRLRGKGKKDRIANISAECTQGHLYEPLLSAELADHPASDKPDYHVLFWPPPILRAGRAAL